MSSFLDDVNNPRWQQASAMSYCTNCRGQRCKLVSFEREVLRLMLTKILFLAVAYTAAVKCCKVHQNLHHGHIESH
jgi:hypothetical protein